MIGMMALQNNWLKRCENRVKFQLQGGLIAQKGLTDLRERSFSSSTRLHLCRAQKS